MNSSHFNPVNCHRSTDSSQNSPAELLSKTPNHWAMWNWRKNNEHVLLPSKNPNGPLCSHPDLSEKAAPAWWEDHISAVLTCWLVEKVTASVTLHLLDNFPVSQNEYTGSTNRTSPDYFLQPPLWSCWRCWGSAGSCGHGLAQIRATLASGKASRLLLFQRLDCGLCYASSTLHLLVTRSPDTPTWFSRSSVYSLPSASQMLQLNKILLLQFSLKCAPLPFCSSSDQL